MGIFKTSTNLIKNLFSAPQTNQYPEGELLLPEAARGNVGIEEGTCTLCGLCQRRCPASAIIVDRIKGQWLIDRMKCIACGECINECPEKCLHIIREYTEPEDSVVIDVFDAEAVEGSDNILKEIEMPMTEVEFPESLKKSAMATREVQSYKRRHRKQSGKKNKKNIKHRNKSRA